MSQSEPVPRAEKPRGIVLIERDVLQNKYSEADIASVPFKRYAMRYLFAVLIPITLKCALGGTGAVLGDVAAGSERSPIATMVFLIPMYLGWQFGGAIGERLFTLRLLPKEFSALQIARYIRMSSIGGLVAFIAMLLVVFINVWNPMFEYHGRPYWQFAATIVAISAAVAIPIASVSAIVGAAVTDHKSKDLLFQIMRKLASESAA